MNPIAAWNTPTCLDGVHVVLATWEGWAAAGMPTLSRGAEAPVQANGEFRR